MSTGSTHRTRALALGAIAALTPAGSARADGQLWTGATAPWEASKRVELSFSLDLRFDQDISRVGAVLPEATAHYRIKKWLRVGGGYRFEYERDTSGRIQGQMVVRHRVAADVKLRGELDPVRFDYRLMLTEAIRPASNNQLKTALRNRFDVSYQAAKPWKPFAGFEVFHALGDLSKVEYSKLRVTVGTAYAMKDHEVEGYFRIEAPQDPMDPTLYIFGLGYGYDP